MVYYHDIHLQFYYVMDGYGDDVFKLIKQCSQSYNIHTQNTHHIHFLWNVSIAKMMMNADCKSIRPKSGMQICHWQPFFFATKCMYPLIRKWSTRFQTLVLVKNPPTKLHHLVPQKWTYNYAYRWVHEKCPLDFILVWEKCWPSRFHCRLM